MARKWRGKDKQPDSIIRMKGAVTQVLQGAIFRVILPNGRQVVAHISGRIRNQFIRISEGDIVSIEMSPYDLGRARITVGP